MPMRVAAAEAEAAQRVAYEDAAKEGERRRAGCHDQRVRDPAWEVCLLQEEAVMLQRRLDDGERVDPGIEQGLVWLDGNEQHPEEGKEEKDRVQRQR